MKLYNRLPRKALNFQSPKQISIDGKNPDWTKFKIFGCLVLAHFLDQKRHKLSEKAISGIFVGTEVGHQVLVFDPESGEVHFTKEFGISFMKHVS